MNFSWMIPNKLVGSMGPVLEQELQYLRSKGVRAIARLEQDTISGEGTRLVDMAEYVPDFGAPTMDQTDRILAFIQGQIDDGAPVVVSCKAGVGRTGTVLACHLVHGGERATDAIQRVRSLRPSSMESAVQMEFMYRYEQRLRNPQP